MHKRKEKFLALATSIAILGGTVFAPMVSAANANLGTIAQILSTQNGGGGLGGLGSIFSGAFGGTPFINSSYATYTTFIQPMENGDVEKLGANLWCMANPKKPEVNQDVTIMCFPQVTSKGTKVTSAGFGGVMGGGGSSGLGMTTVTPTKSTGTATQLSWILSKDKVVKPATDSEPAEIKTIKYLLVANIQVGAYEGSNSMGSGNSNGTGITGGSDVTYGGGASGNGSSLWGDPSVTGKGGTLNGSENTYFTPNDITIPGSNTGECLGSGANQICASDTSGSFDSDDGNSRMNDLLNNLFDDNDDSYNANPEDWTTSDTGGLGSENLDNYFENGDVIDNGIDTTDETGDVQYIVGEDGGVGGFGAQAAAYNPAEATEQYGDAEDNSLSSLLGRYQDGIAGLDGLNGDNGSLLDAINGKNNNSIASKIGELLGMSDSSSGNYSPTESNNQLFNVAKDTLMANGTTMEEIVSGKTYDSNSAFTEPKTAWDMNRITTLMKTRKLKIDGVKTNNTATRNPANRTNASPQKGTGNVANAAMNANSKPQNASLTK